jgi:hypothetical protein
MGALLLKHRVAKQHLGCYTCQNKNKNKYSKKMGALLMKHSVALEDLGRYNFLVKNNFLR